MSTHKFNVGDRICWQDMGKATYYGVILELRDHGRYSIQFEENFSIRYSIGNIYNSFTDINGIKLAGPPLTKEERVLEKCKKLWNQSNWVKNNPQLGY